MKNFSITIGLICLAIGDSILAQEAQDSDFSKHAVYRNIDPTEEQDFERLPPPQPGDWLHQFPETGQTLEQYKANDSKPLITAKRRCIVLQPLGEFSEEQKVLLIALEEYAQAYFQVPARVAKPLKLPGVSKNSLTRTIPVEQRSNNRDHQYEAREIVSKLLLPKIPSDAAVYLGITMEDLYAGELNYVFGFGSFENRTGVYSLARYFPEFWNEPTTEMTKLLTVRRSFKVLNHEASHVFGLKHCIFFDCTMNGSNSLSETDRSSVHECPVCHQKLLWNLKFDPQKRFQSLSEVYTKYGLLDESAWLTNRSEHWKQSNSPSKETRRIP